MDLKSEQERIESNNFHPFPSNPWIFNVKFDSNPLECMDRILSILEFVAKYNQNESWPSDTEWRCLLPNWLKEEIRELGKEQTDYLLEVTPRDQWNSLPWDFLSWLDALRDRGWCWWGYKLENEKATIILHIEMFPERIGAFRELLRAAGACIVSEQYPAIIKD